MRPGKFLSATVAICCWSLFASVTTHAAPASPGAGVESGVGGDWQRATPGWPYRFPADHRAHRDFKTEWWYFTGQLRTEGNGRDVREFGYELTFFRQGVLPPGRRREAPVNDDGSGRSRFVQDDFKFAHLAITDINGRRFYFTQKISRGAFGEAGFGTGDETDPRLAWIEGWDLRVEADGSWHIQARSADPALALDLRVRPVKPPVIHGLPGEGISRKGEGEGNASHYYSFTRLETSGSVSLPGEAAATTVRGESWFDHEWASNGLGPDQVGWDWFCFHCDDGTELMLYAMRRRDGTMDPVSSGTLIAVDGSVTHLRREDFSLQPAGNGGTWRSPRTGAIYPIVWQVKVPAQNLEFTVRPRLDAQELALSQLAYWEGATTITGTRAGQPLKGLGYMELTGYAGALIGLSR
jgi:predicted secreted hydrolase